MFQHSLNLLITRV